MVSFKNFFHKNDLKNKATSIIKLYEVLSSLSLRDIGIYLRNGPFESDIGFVDLQPPKDTHWVVYINESYSDSNGYSPTIKLSKISIKRNGHCLYSE